MFDLPSPLADQIKELEFELRDRETRFRTLVLIGQMTQAEADQRNRCLRDTLTSLRWVCDLNVRVLLRQPVHGVPLADQIDVVEAEIEQRGWGMVEPDVGLRCMEAVLETLQSVQSLRRAFPGQLP